MDYLLLQWKIVFSEPFAGNDHHIVAEDERFHKIPEFGIGVSDIDMTAPDPGLCLFVEFDERERLRVVHDNAVVVQVRETRKAVIRFQIEVLFIIG
jgi:hypothetical protein